MFNKILVLCLAGMLSGCGRANTDLLDFGFGKNFGVNPDYQHGWMPGVANGTCSKDKASVPADHKIGQGFWQEKGIKRCPPIG